MAGRPKIEADGALAADVRRRLVLHGLSIRQLGAELGIPRSSAHRLAKHGAISGKRRASVRSWLEAVDRAGAPVAIFDRAADAIREHNRKTELDSDWFWEIAEPYGVGLAPDG